jgi:cytochrome b subunit of formate dehydrogenase
MTGRPFAIILATIAATAGLTTDATRAQDDLDDASCFECHDDPDLVKELPDGSEVSLFVSDTLYAASVHGDGGLACIDCHADIEEIPHDEILAAVDCGICHDDSVEEYEAGLHSVSRVNGDMQAPSCVDCHGTHEIFFSDDSRSLTHPVNLPQTCARCHSDPALVRTHHIAAEAPLDAYLQSVHGRALLVDGNEDAPSCENCHGHHKILPKEDPASPLHHSNVPNTCAQCHREISEIFIESVHGVAVLEDNRDAPACNDCHGEHRIEEHTSPTSLVYPKAIAETTCTRCHESEILAQRYGFAVDRPETFRETYHGLAGRLGGLPVANCAPCHGIHNIFPSSDARSTVHPANLQETCGHCHPSASERFVQITVHDPATKQPRHAVSQTIKQIYIWLLVIVIGGMFVHNLIIWISYVVRKYRRERQGTQYRRFSKFEVIEHVILVVSFLTLVVTGFALKYSDTPWVGWMSKLGFDEGLRSLVHRVCGVIMIALSIVHTVFFLGTRRGRRDLRHLRPTAMDVKEFVGTMAYYLGRRGEKPRSPRYDYAEKAEYLALIWGTVVMAITGLVLWFPNQFTRFAPGWLVEVSEVVHFYEAWLAFLAIVVWHWFFVIMHPEEYPLNLTFLTGKITKHKAEERNLPPEDLESDEEYGEPDEVNVPPRREGVV